MSLIYILCETLLSPPTMPSASSSSSTEHHTSPSIPQVSLQYLWEKEYQVLVFYHHPMALEVPFLWPGQMMPSPWANTTDPEKLVQFLQASVTDRRSAAALFISLWAPRIPYRINESQCNVMFERLQKVDCHHLYFLFNRFTN